MAANDIPGPRPGAQERLGLSREEAEAALAARQELGRDYEPAVVDSFVERVDRVIDARVEQRLDARLGRKPKRAMGSGTLAIISLTFAVPLSAIAAATTHLPGLIVTWCAIILINVAHAVRRPR